MRRIRGWLDILATAKHIADGGGEGKEDAIRVCDIAAMALEKEGYPVTKLPDGRIVIEEDGLVYITERKPETEAPFSLEMADRCAERVVGEIINYIEGTYGSDDRGPVSEVEVIDDSSAAEGGHAPKEDGTDTRMETARQSAEQPLAHGDTIPKTEHTEADRTAEAPATPSYPEHRISRPASSDDTSQLERLTKQWEQTKKEMAQQAENQETVMVTGTAGSGKGPSVLHGTPSPTDVQPLDRAEIELTPGHPTEEHSEAGYEEVTEDEYEGVFEEPEEENVPEIPEDAYNDHMTKDDITLAYYQVRIRNKDGQDVGRAEVIVSPLSLEEGDVDIIAWANDAEKSEVRMSRGGRSSVLLKAADFDIIAEGEMEGGHFRSNISLTKSWTDAGYTMKLGKNAGAATGTKGHVVLEDEGAEIHIVPLSRGNTDTGNAEFCYAILLDGESPILGDNMDEEEVSFRYHGAAHRLVARWNESTLYAAVIPEEN